MRINPSRFPSKKTPTFEPMLKSHIHFYFQDVQIPLGERTRLKTFIQKLLSKHGREILQLNYIFCTDPFLRKLNKTHLGHDYFTDIVTFDLSENPRELEAEIYISIDRVRDNAKSYQTTLKEELHRVIFHGALHLCGFSDKTPPEREIMEKQENQCLIRYST